MSGNLKAQVGMLVENGGQATEYAFCRFGELLRVVQEVHAIEAGLAHGVEEA